MSQSPPATSPALRANDPERHLRTDHLTIDLRRRSARGGAVTVGAQALKFVISMGSTIVLARLLTPQDFGLIGMVAIIYDFVSMFQYMGLSTATIQWPELQHRQVSTLFWINVTLSVLIAVLTASSGPAVAWFYHEPRLVWITVWYSVAILLTGLFIQHEALLARQMRFTAIAVVEVTALLAGLLAAIAGALHGLGYRALVLNLLVTTLASVVGSWIACGWRPGLPRRGVGVRAMLSFGGTVTGYNLFNYFARNLDNLLIGKYWGPYQLGLYAKAYQMLLLPLQQINVPFTSVVVPTLSRLTDAPDRYRTAYLKAIEQLAMLTMPGVSLMIATADWLVLFVLGPQWRETGHIFMLLGVAAIMQPVTRTAWWLFSTQRRSREMLQWGVISGGIAVLSIIAGLPWGAIGVATAYAVADVSLSTPLLFWFVGRKGPVRTGDFYRAITPATCASLCTLVVLFGAHATLEPWPLVGKLSTAFVTTLATSFLVFAALPAGRSALRNVKEMLVMLFKSGV